MDRLHLPVLLALAALAAPSQAAKFKIDEGGARPRKFRVTCLARRLDTGLTPDIYKSGLFDRKGRSIKEAPHLSMAIGIQGGKLVLLDEEGWQTKTYRVIGDASDLDQIRLDPGVVFRGRTEWDTGSIAWRVSSNALDLGLPLYEGPILDEAWARDTLLAHLATGVELSPSNREVLTSVQTQSWTWFVSHDQEDQGVPHFLAKARARYLDPLQQAMAQADGEGRARLADLNQKMLEAAQDQLDYYRKDDWRPPIYVQAFEAIVAALGEMQQRLEG